MPGKSAKRPELVACAYMLTWVTSELIRRCASQLLRTKIRLRFDCVPPIEHVLLQYEAMGMISHYKVYEALNTDY